MTHSDYLVDKINDRIQKAVEDSGKKITLGEYEQLIKTVVECICLNMDDIVSDTLEGILMERVVKNKNDKGGNTND